MRQLAFKVYPQPITNGSQVLFDVYVGANEFADSKHLIVVTDYTLMVNAPGIGPGLTLLDNFYWDGGPPTAFNVAAASGLPLAMAFNVSYRETWDLYRHGTELRGSMVGEVYATTPRLSAVSNVSTVLKLNTGAGAPDWSIPHVLSFGYKANMNAAAANWTEISVRALIESPVNIGRTPL
jgi:hypothetical protein